ncbi:MAG: hypothetical protein ACTSXD_05715 [Candidatus Heimdallarchaeaceae archaeon]
MYSITKEFTFEGAYKMYGVFYRLIMKIAHRYHWHYAPPSYPDGDTQLWCKWCGFRQTVKHKSQSNQSFHIDRQIDASGSYKEGQ